MHCKPDIEWPCRCAEETYNAIRRISVERIGGMGEPCSPNRDRSESFSPFYRRRQASGLSRESSRTPRFEIDSAGILNDGQRPRPPGFRQYNKALSLANLVMFPHVVLPLHIFEPRYRQMTEDALAGDGLISIIQITPSPKGEHWKEPVPLESVGCLGKIIQHERLADGRFNILLLGRKRVRLRERDHPQKNSIGSPRSRSSRINPPTQPEGPARGELTSLFRELFESQQRLDADLDELLNKPVPLGLLADIISPRSRPASGPQAKTSGGEHCRSAVVHDPIASFARSLQARASIDCFHHLSV